MIEVFQAALSWPWWQQAGVVATALGAVVVAALQVFRALTQPTDDDDGRKLIKYMLAHGPRRRRFSVYTRRLGKFAPARVHVLLRECGGVQVRSPVPGVEMWGLKKRNPGDALNE